MGNTLSPRLPTGTRLTRRLSSGLWRGISTDINEPDSGFFKFEDFHAPGASGTDFTFTADGTTPTFTIDATEGNMGVWAISTGSTTIDEGGELRFTNHPMVPNAGVVMGLRCASSP